MTENREKILAKIRALSEKTIENGCTEAEAIAAAQKVNDLLAQYGLQRDELDIRKSEHVLEEIEITLAGGKFKHPLQFGLFGVERFTETKCWLQQRRSLGTGQKRQMACFFGEPQDVAVAKYLVQIMRRAIDDEYELFRAREQAWGRKVNPWAFRNAMAITVGNRLCDMKRQRDGQIQMSTGTALMVVKHQVVERAFQEMDIKLRGKGGPGATVSDARAAQAGREAGHRVQLNPGLTQQGSSGAPQLR